MTCNLGPIQKQSAGTTSAATPIAASAGVHFGVRSYARPLAGLAMVVFIVVIIAVTFFLYGGGATESVPVTVLSPRAGLVMNPQAKVELRGVQVGRVSSIAEESDSQAAIHLAIDPSQLEFIPANVHVDIEASTIFGAKSIRLVGPADPAEQPLRSAQLLGAENVTLESNTLFQQLVSTSSAIDPVKLNEGLGAQTAAASVVALRIRERRLQGELMRARGVVAATTTLSSICAVASPRY